MRRRTSRSSRRRSPGRRGRSRRRRSRRRRRRSQRSNSPDGNSSDDDKCQICYEPYGEGREKLPACGRKQHPCKKSICSECAKQLVRNKCPYCNGAELAAAAAALWRSHRPPGPRRATERSTRSRGRGPILPEAAPPPPSQRLTDGLWIEGLRSYLSSAEEAEVGPNPYRKIRELLSSQDIGDHMKAALLLVVLARQQHQLARLMQDLNLNSEQLRRLLSALRRMLRTVTAPGLITDQRPALLQDVRRVIEGVRTAQRAQRGR